ncbi:MAG TPA: hypothetical protein VFB72_07030, partial [Verrucomicrobiae bacterium]|nr:hypothetical protein [Verrucomicrobiae bacterium]
MSSAHSKHRDACSIAVSFFDPEGVKEISRGLSEATPPEKRDVPLHPEGVQERIHDLNFFHAFRVDFLF